MARKKNKRPFKKVTQTKLILWFIQSRGSQGATFSEVQRFVVETLQKKNYDQFEYVGDWEKESRFRDTGERVWAFPGQTYLEAVFTHGGQYLQEHGKVMVTVDERLPRQGPVKLKRVRVWRGRYSDHLGPNNSYGPGILGKYCKKIGRKYLLNEEGMRTCWTIDPVEPESPRVAQTSKRRSLDPSSRGEVSRIRDHDEVLRATGDRRAAIRAYVAGNVWATENARAVGNLD